MPVRLPFDKFDNGIPLVVWPERPVSLEVWKRAFDERRAFNDANNEKQ